MVRRAIILKSASAAVHEMRPGVDNELQRLLERKPPEFDVRVAEDQKGVPEGFVAIEISGAEEAGADVSDFSILSNSRNVGDFASRSISGDGKKAVIQVPVDDGQNQITITGVNDYGYLTERSVVAIARKTEKAARKGKLYVVVVGAEKYPLLPTDCSGRPCDLSYPGRRCRGAAARAGGQIGAALCRAGGAGPGQPRVARRDARARSGNRQDRRHRCRARAGVGQHRRPDRRLPGQADRRRHHDRVRRRARHQYRRGLLFHPLRRPQIGSRTNGSARRWSTGPTSRRRSSAPTAYASCCSTPATPPTPSTRGSRRTRPTPASWCSRRPPPTARPPSFRSSDTASSPIRCCEGLRGAANTGGDGVRLLGLADFIYREVTKLTNSRQKPFYYISSMENILLAQP